MISYDTHAFFKNYSTEFTTPDFIGFSVFFSKKFDDVLSFPSALRSFTLAVIL